jgi:hypothetical protein
VQIADKNGVKEQEISLGDIDSNATCKKTFKVQNGGSFSVYASIPQSALVFKSSAVTVTGDQDPFERSIVLKDQCQILDDTKSLSTLSQSFKNLGDNIGAEPLDLKNALQTRIGALIVAVPPGADKKARILSVLTPGQLGVKVLGLDDISYPGTNETQEIMMSGKVATKADATIGPLAHFGFTFDSENLYNLKWVMRGFGQVAKAEDVDKNYIVQFNALDEDIKDNIKSLLKANADARLYYINSFYVLQKAELFVRAATKLNSGADLNASNVVTGNAVYSFEHSQEQNNGYGPVVLNYWGSEFTLMTTDAEPVKKNAKYSSMSAFSEFLKNWTKKSIDLLLATGNKVGFSTE